MRIVLKYLFSKRNAKKIMCFQPDIVKMHKMQKIIADSCCICYNKSDKKRRGWLNMNVGIIAHNSKKPLIEDFCIAYKNILAKHEVYATGTTGRRIEEVTNLRVHKFLPGSMGGDKQITEMIERGDIDMVIFFYNPSMINPKEPDVYQISRCCDQYNVPIATNIATAESLILGLDHGDLDWRLNK